MGEQASPILTTGAGMQTFVVRVRVEPTGRANGTASLHGVVEHVGSGGATTFADDSELLSFLHEAAGRRVGQTGDAP
ncbi:MAG: hypothetical protein ACRDQT_09655 [Gaiellaceae bacterium]